VGGGLVILGGVIALIGIANPRRRVAAEECPGGALVGASRHACGGGVDAPPEPAVAMA
jgi:hypothetical protein